MNKMKNWLIAGLVFLIAGAVICAVAAALMGFDPSRMELFVNGGFIH